MSRSKQNQQTAACRLRFVNNSDQFVEVLWLNYEGQEQRYAVVKPRSQHTQETFSTHPWRVKSQDSQQVLGYYVGQTAVVEITQNLGCNVHPGTAKHVCPKQAAVPSHWGNFCQRSKINGIDIMAYDCVPEAAVAATADTLSYMLRDVPHDIIQRLIQNEADIAIIGRDQVVSDMPPHCHLKGEACAVGERTFDHGTRGVGGNLGCPTCSVGEENVLMEDDKHYWQENILIHEFAHSIMCIGMDQEQRKSIEAAFEEAKAAKLYQSYIYMMANADEYWAEAAQSWFDATVRTDVNDGMNTRDMVKAHDPLLATLLMQTYGDGSWRYTHTMPKDWGGGCRSTPIQAQAQQLHARHAPSAAPQLQVTSIPSYKPNRNCGAWLSALWRSARGKNQ